MYARHHPALPFLVTRPLPWRQHLRTAGLLAVGVLAFPLVILGIAAINLTLWLAGARQD